MKIYTADRETGTFIEECASVEDAISQIDVYEAKDEAEGVYEPNFYDVVDENHCSLL